MNGEFGGDPSRWVKVGCCAADIAKEENCSQGQGEGPCAWGNADFAASGLASSVLNEF